MFNIFKRKPKYQDLAFEDLSNMLLDEKESPTYKCEIIDPSVMDFSLESLKHLDQYIDEIRSDEISEEDLTRLVLRAGAYLGEVMRKNSELEFHWLDFNAARKISTLVEELGMQLGTAAVLWSTPDNICFPLAKILKFIENGVEDNTHSFAIVLLNGVPDEQEE